MLFRRIVCVVLCLLLASSAMAQEATRELKNFRMLLNDGEFVQGKDGLISGSRLTGTTKGGESLDIPLADIHSLDVSQGSAAGKGALIGADIGLGSALMAIVQVNADETTELDNDKVAPVTLGLTGVGALIGAAVGAGSRTWENVPLTEDVGLRIGVTQVAGGVGLSYRF